MHMSDALLSPQVGGAMWLASGVAVAVAARHLRGAQERVAPLMAVLGAFVFSAQMINFTLPGTGSSGHLAGALLLAILLGPHAALLAITSVLTVQALLFADGGLIALGANIFNLGVVACYLVYPLLYRPLAGDASPLSRRGAFATFVAAVAALQAGALGVVLETTLSGISALPFAPFAALMLPIHLAIGAVEGVVTVAVLRFVLRVEPGLARHLPGRPPRRRTLATLLGVAALTGGLLSWAASENPDGLEWSIDRLGGAPEEVAPDTLHADAARLQTRIAPMPDYALPPVETGAVETAAGAEGLGQTTLAGLLGGSTTLLVAGLAGWALRRHLHPGTE